MLFLVCGFLQKHTSCNKLKVVKKRGLGASSQQHWCSSLVYRETQKGESQIESPDGKSCVLCQSEISSEHVIFVLFDLLWESLIALYDY